MKCVVLLRNPIDRAFSHHNHECVLGFERLSFEEALAREPERLEGEVERLMLDPNYRSIPLGHYAYFARGVYVDQLERWFAHVPRERFLILQSERMFADPAAVMREVQGFLGLPFEEVPDLSPRYWARLRADRAGHPPQAPSALHAP